MPTPSPFHILDSTTFNSDASYKPNIQIRFSSEAMDSIYEILCHHSLGSPDPLLDELLTYFPTRFSSYIFDYVFYEYSRDDPYYSDSNLSALYSDYSTYFS